MRNLILILLLLFSISLFGGEPIKIGTSNHPEATAFNNARKIARDFGNQRVVVYQDIVDNANVIKMTKSGDGVNWTEPRILANGSNPAIGVSKDYIFYIVWENRKELGEYGEYNSYIFDFDESRYAKYTNLITTSQTDLDEFIYPTIEITQDYIITACIRNSRPVFNFMKINDDQPEFPEEWTCIIGDSIPCGRIAVAGDLEYDGMHRKIDVVWDHGYDGDNRFAAIWEQEINGSKDLYYLFIDNLEDLPRYLQRNNYSNNFSEWATEDNRTLIYGKIPDTKNCSNPSLSSRFGYNYRLEWEIIAAWDSPEGVQIVKGSQRSSNEYSWKWWSGNKQIPSGECLNAFPMTDDILPGPMSSTAVIWQNNGNLCYTQTDRCIADSVLHLSNTMEILYPNICYKIYRQDLFDVVWIQPNGDRYDIMYERFEKDYQLAFEKCEIYDTELPDAYVGEFYQYNLEASHGGVTWLFDGNIPANCYVSRGEIIFDPYPVFSGVYDFTLVLGPYYTTMIPALCDTAHFTLTIHKSRETSVNGEQIPSDFALHPNYPNPFNPSTQIQYDLPESADVVISIYNINGKLVEKLMQKKQTAGSHKITWQADNLPSGTYFIRMQAGVFEQTRKCLLIK